MRCSEPGQDALAAIHAPRGLAPWGLRPQSRFQIGVEIIYMGTEPMATRSKLFLGGGRVMKKERSFVVLANPFGSRPELSVSRVVDVSKVDALEGVDFRLHGLIAATDDQVVFLKVRNPSRRTLSFWRGESSAQSGRPLASGSGRWLAE